jgi:chromosomal replication initiator protein
MREFCVFWGNQKFNRASDFFTDFTLMLHDKEKRWEFEQRYHNVDVILLDDVQYLEGKEATTNEVFQIINTFTSKNKQVVLSADRPPFDIAVDERHHSRYAQGPTIDIQPPDFDMKYAIFVNYFDYCCRKIDRSDLKELMTREIIERVIELSSDNIRELNGATASLVAYLSVRQNKFETLTIEEVEKRVLNVFAKTGEKRIDISAIQKEIESFYKISHNDLLSKKRSQGISYPRQVAMYLARGLTGESYPDIGKAFGGKDHTSVMYACNQIEKKRQTSKKLDKEIESLTTAIKT